MQFGTKKTYVGRAPVTLVGSQLFAFTSREGKDIIVNENNDQSHFKPVSKVEVSNFSFLVKNIVFNISINAATSNTSVR